MLQGMRYCTKSGAFIATGPSMKQTRKEMKQELLAKQEESDAQKMALIESLAERVSELEQKLRGDE